MSAILLFHSFLVEGKGGHPRQSRSLVSDLETATFDNARNKGEPKGTDSQLTWVLCPEIDTETVPMQSRNGRLCRVAVTDFGESFAPLIYF